jgi:hypothetical protein
MYKEKRATFEQASQILQLIMQKKRSRGEVQDLIASGLLSDLLEADIAKVTDRNVVRKALSLEEVQMFPFDGRVCKTFEELTQDLRRYGIDCSRFVTESRFPFQPWNGRVAWGRRDSYEFLGPSTSTSTAEILQEAAGRNLVRPTISEALIFGYTYAREKITKSVVFLHAPVDISVVGPSVLSYHRNGADGRGLLSIGSYDSHWIGGVTFAFRRSWHNPEE